MYTIPCYLNRKNTHFKFKEMLKTPPSHCRISQRHPFSPLLVKPLHFTFLILRFLKPQTPPTSQGYWKDKQCVCEGTWFRPASCRKARRNFSVKLRLVQEKETCWTSTTQESGDLWGTWQKGHDLHSKPDCTLSRALQHHWLPRGDTGMSPPECRAGTTWLQHSRLPVTSFLTLEKS